jgi:hypothetical protein
LLVRAAATHDLLVRRRFDEPPDWLCLPWLLLLALLASLPIRRHRTPLDVL